VAIRSTLAPGTITLTASRAGLASATVQIESHPADVKDGVETPLPQTFAGLTQPIPGLVP